MEQVGSDERDASSIQLEWARAVALGYPNNTDYNSGLAWPLVAFASGVNYAAVCANPAQARSPSITLTDGVRGDETEASVSPELVECTPEEVCNKVGVAVRLNV